MTASEGKGTAHHREESGPYPEGNRKPGCVLRCGVTFADLSVFYKDVFGRCLENVLEGFK